MIFTKNFARNYEKKMIHITSDAGSVGQSSHRLSDPAYYIKDCQIFLSKVCTKKVDWAKLLKRHSSKSI